MTQQEIEKWIETEAENLKILENPDNYNYPNSAVDDIKKRYWKSGATALYQLLKDQRETNSITEKAIRQEAEEYATNEEYGHAMRPHIEEAYIAAASRYVKEIEELKKENERLKDALESSKGVLFSIKDDLPKESLGKIFVEKEISAIDQQLKTTPK